MNKIRINRMILAGAATFFVWVVVEIFVEQIIGRTLFGDLIESQMLQATNYREWGVANYAVNILRALINCTIFIWLYASLRPMYGVGTRTALITTAFGIIWAFSIIINGVNLGYYPLQAGLVEWVYEIIEFPLAMIVGATVYEGMSEPVAA